MLMIALLCEGHVLIEDVRCWKTTLASALENLPDFLQGTVHP